MSMNTPNTPPPDEALLRNLLDRIARREVTVDEALPQVKLLAQHSLQTSGAASIQAFTTMLQPMMRRQTAAAGWVVGLVFAAIGTTFFCVGLFFGWRSLQFMDAPQADGVITSVAGGTPTAKYTVNNQEFTVTGKISSKPPAFAVGEKCTVLYKADNPKDAIIDSFVERWLFLLIFGGLGAVFGLIGWGTLFFKIVGRLFRPRPIDDSQRFTVE